MMENIIVILVAFSGLVAGSVTDIKKREVPDWINYGLVMAGIGIAVIFSVISDDLMILVRSIAGFGLMFLLGVLMFYTGQWGGGDSKMLMGLGALFGVAVALPLADTLSRWIEDPPFLFIFLLMSLVTGAIYGLIWSAALAVKNRKSFVDELKAIMAMRKVIMIKYACIFMLIILLALALLIEDMTAKVLLMMLGIMLPLLFYMIIFVKTIEKTCMIKNVRPKELTEGDWIAQDIIINGKVFAGPKDLGISKEKIEKLKGYYAKGKIKRVAIKEGIPFVPNFLIAFIAALAYVLLL